MKKYLMLFLLIVLLSGCSVEIDIFPSKVDLYSSKIEDLDNSFIKATDSLESLRDKQTLTDKEEEQIINTVDTLLKEIQEFKEEQAPFMARMIENVIEKELDKKETILLDIKEKGKAEKLTEEDIKLLVDTLSHDIEITLFDK